MHAPIIACCWAGRLLGTNTYTHTRAHTRGREGERGARNVRRCWRGALRGEEISLLHTAASWLWLRPVVSRGEGIESFVTCWMEITACQSRGRASAICTDCPLAQSTEMLLFSWFLNLKYPTCSQSPHDIQQYEVTHCLIRCRWITAASPLQRRIFRITASNPYRIARSSPFPPASEPNRWVLAVVIGTVARLVLYVGGGRNAVVNTKFCRL